MKDLEELRLKLHRIDGRGYKAYKDIRGSYKAEAYELFIDHVQGDPFAAPSHLRLRVSKDLAGFPPETYSNRSREIALRDYITRSFYRAAGRLSKPNKGSGKSGLIGVERPGQEILERNSVVLGGEWIELRFVMGLPAFGRKVAGRNAETMFFTEVPEIAAASLFFKALDRKKLYRHIEASEDADFLRRRLPIEGLIAFVADGAILPRRSGIDPRPMDRARAVPFSSPESLCRSFDLPNAGTVTGMAIERGVTLIAGGGYHGKSTLLNALQLGIYNHVPEDGRELVVTDGAALKIRAEDGRRIEKTEIDAFISNLPFGEDTAVFSTENASGSTSQAANIIEAMELGVSAFLIDEDSSATNFMIRDHRMQELVAANREPITPFIDRVRQLYEQHDISTLLVIGGSGDYFDVADLVISMDSYLPYERTFEAQEIARRFATWRRQEGGDSFPRPRQRSPLAQSLDPSKGKRDVKIAVGGLSEIRFGVHNIDLSGQEQLVDQSQLRSIADAMVYAKRYMDGKRSLREVLTMLFSDIESNGLDVIHPRPVGDYAAVRPLEVAAAINRLRTLEVRQV